MQKRPIFKFSNFYCDYFSVTLCVAWHFAEPQTWMAQEGLWVRTSCLLVKVPSYLPSTHLTVHHYLSNLHLRASGITCVSLSSLLHCTGTVMCHDDICRLVNTKEYYNTLELLTSIPWLSFFNIHNKTIIELSHGFKERKLRLSKWTIMAPVQSTYHSYCLISSTNQPKFNRRPWPMYTWELLSFWP